MKTNKRILITLIASVFLIGIQKSSKAHCEIPCGIYEDSLRISLIKEHIVTIEKSMKQIIELSKTEKPNYNQLIRWVNNKEDHANKIQEIVSQYFLHQRIKLTDPENEELHKKYVIHLTSLHKLLVYSMKAKQTTDLSYIEKLNSTVKEFSDAYFHKHEH